MRIALAQVVVTAEMETIDGERIRVRQSTEAEEELAVIYNLLDVKPNPIGKVKSVVHPNLPTKTTSWKPKGYVRFSCNVG